MTTQKEFFTLGESQLCIPTLCPEEAVAKILLIEKYFEIKDALRFVLEEHSYEVITADEAHAFERATAEHPAITMINAALFYWPSDKSCHSDLVLRLQNSPKLSDMKIVVMSSFGERARVDPENSLGDVAWICLPFETSKLLETIEQLL